MRTSALLLAALCLCAFLAWRPASDPRIASFTADPKSSSITLHWKSADGQVIGNIGHLKTLTEGRGKKLVFAMNAGMYMEDQRPLGLYIEEGRSTRKLITQTTGYGNFYMQPNGVFGVDSAGAAFVVPTAEQGTQKRVRCATQSGPMLVVGGMINPGFTAGSPNLNIRNGVGILPNGTVLFAISKEPVNFHDFAQFFLDKGCKNALYLDGAVSRAYIPSLGLAQMDGRLGPLIAVTE